MPSEHFPESSFDYHRSRSIAAAWQSLWSGKMNTAPPFFFSSANTSTIILHEAISPYGPLHAMLPEASSGLVVDNGAALFYVGDGLGVCAMVLDLERYTAFLINGTVRDLSPVVEIAADLQRTRWRGVVT